jgi:hypothetical protein
VQQVKGNIFQTRIFPIPSQGSRTAKIIYTSELTTTKNNQAVWLHPVSLGHPIDFEATIEVLAEKDAVPSFVNEQYAGAKFVPSAAGTSFVCKINKADWSSSEASLVVTLPVSNGIEMYLEHRAGLQYFAVGDELPVSSSEPSTCE